MTIDGQVYPFKLARRWKRLLQLVLMTVALYCCASSLHAQAYVQSVGFDGTNPSVAFPSNVGAGHQIIIACGSKPAYGNCTAAPTDTLGNIFTLISDVSDATNEAEQQVWHTLNTVAGADTVQCYSAANIACYAVEFSGANTLDQGSNATQQYGSTNTATSPTVTTTHSNEIAIGFGSGNPGAMSWNSAVGPWTPIAAGNQVIAYQIVSSIGNYQFTVTQYAGATNIWAMGIFTYYQASTIPITLNPQTVAAGYTSLGTVSLAAPAPAGGATVTLSSSNTAVATVPGSVLVPAGSTSATFTVSTSSVSSSTLVNISATYNGATNIATLAVVPVNPSPQYSIWSSSATPVVSDDGGTSAVEVGVKFTADTSGFISGIRFYKSAANTGTHVGNLWTSTGQLLATATFTGETASGWQSVNFSSPILLTANTVYVASYHTNTGHTSDDHAYFTNIGVNNSPLHAPASAASGGNGVLTLGAGSVFPDTTSLDSNYWVDVAFIASSSPPPLQSLTLNPTNVGGGSTSTGTVTLNTPAPSGGVLVVLSTGNPAVATVPPSVSVAQGATSASFTVNTSPVAASTPVSISASLAGAIVSATLTVNPPPAITAVTLNPANVVGGVTNPTGTVTLNAAAPTGGLTVNLSSDNTLAATVPATVTVAAGQTVSPNFTVTTLAVAATATAHISATFNGGTQSAMLTVNPASALSSLWTLSTTPGNVTGNDAQSVELGLKFTASLPGSVVGIRFYKATNSTSTHTGTLWSSTGTALATGTFSGETASGWQTLTFASPVAINAGATYVVSYHTSQYVWNAPYFTQAYVNGPLSAPINAGVYRYGTSRAFPSSVYNASNYWVDVLFLPSGP